MMQLQIDLLKFPLKFYNTETRKKEPFVFNQQRQVRIYTCGPTVYDYAHIGNYRTYIFEDLLRRSLKFFGAEVIQVMNLTDVDDKTIRGALKKGVSLDAYTETFKQAFFEDLAALNIEPAEHYPAATDYIDAMIEMIQQLLDKGIAYVGGDGSIYYAIQKFPRYGCLSHLNLDELKAGASERVATDEYDKEHLADFVLWKKYDAKRDGNIFWDSPFGPGRPGWHIECSAMAIRILGETIDIHCGGVDNMFPHHENEIAQSESCTGHPFVKLWMHSEHLIVDGKKMSKSLGNFYTLRDLLQKGYNGRQVRYLLLQTHYKTQLNFTLEGLEAAKQSLQRLDSLIQRLFEVDREETQLDITPLLEETLLFFAEALADDLNISRGLAALFDFVRELNVLCDRKAIDKKQVEQVFLFLEKLNQVLGVLRLKQEEPEIPTELVEALKERGEARRNKDWKKADILRDFIHSHGYTIEDTPQGARLQRQ